MRRVKRLTSSEPELFGLFGGGSRLMGQLFFVFVFFFLWFDLLLLFYFVSMQCQVSRSGPSMQNSCSDLTCLRSASRSIALVEDDEIKESELRRNRLWSVKP